MTTRAVRVALARRPSARACACVLRHSESWLFGEDNQDVLDLPVSDACTWECPALRQDDFGVLAGDVALHKILPAID